MSEYGDPGSMDPYHLLNVYLPDDATITARVVVAAAIRNPDLGNREIAEFAGTTDTTTRKTLTAFYYGALDTVTMGSNDSTRYGDPSKRTTIDEFTDKQQAVIEFFARYPDVKEHVEKPKTRRFADEWSWTDVRAYIAAHTGISMGSEYLAKIARDHWDFTEQRREWLLDEDVIAGLPDVPERADSVPEDTRSLLGGQIDADTLPDQNLDDEHAFGVDDWIEPYATADLDDVPESALPHARTDEDVVQDVLDARDEMDGSIESDAAAKVADELEPTDPPDDEKPVEIESGNARYEGPAEGIDLAGGGVQTLAEAPAHQPDDDHDCVSEDDTADDDPDPVHGEQVADWLDDAPDGDGEAAADAVRGTYDASEATIDTDDGPSKIVVADVPESLYDRLYDAADERGSSPGRELVRIAQTRPEQESRSDPTDTTDVPSDLRDRLHDALTMARMEQHKTATDAAGTRMATLQWVIGIVDEYMEDPPGGDRL